MAEPSWQRHEEQIEPGRRHGINPPPPHDREHELKQNSPLHRTHTTNVKSRTKGEIKVSNQEHENALRFEPEVPSEPKDGPLQTGHAW
jgi:hypothetical protein